MNIISITKKLNHENKVKDNILEISERLRKKLIGHSTAREELCKLFELEYKPRYRGLAKVNAPNFIYHGHTLKIIGLYMTYDKEGPKSPIKNGTRDFRLCLKGTEFEDSHGYTETTMLETDLEILELWED